METSKKKTQSQPVVLTALKLLNILKEKSDIDHPIPQTELAKILDVDRKTIDRCISVMEGYMDFEIERTRKGVYLIPDDDTFELSEVRLLIDSVLASRMISTEQTEAITSKLSKLVNYHDRKHIPHIHTIKDWSKIDNKNVAISIERFNDAINRGVKVSFDYNRIGGDKKLHIESKYTISPAHLVFSNGQYFVLGYVDSDDDIHAFRIDKITNPKVIEKIASKKSDAFDARDFAATYVEGHPYMSFGKTESIKIRIKASEISRLFDVFGMNVSIPRSEIEKNSEEYTVSLKANSEDVYRFMLQNTDVAELITPQSLRERLMQAARDARNRYLTTSEDLYLAEMKKLQSKQVTDEPDRASMEFSDLDLTKYETFKTVDVSKYYFWKTKLKDLSFVAGKQFLKCFYSFENPIEDYSYLAKAPNLQDISIVFSEIENLDFVPECRCLRSLTLGGARIKDASAMYQPLKPQLEYLKMFWGSEIDVELFKKYNPKTKIIIGRKEAEDKDNDINYSVDVDKRFDDFEYPLNLLDCMIGLKSHGATDDELLEVKRRLIDNPDEWKLIEQELYKNELAGNIIRALYLYHKSALEVACEFDITVDEVFKTRRDVLRGIHSRELMNVQHDFYDKHKSTEEETKADVEWLKNLLEDYKLEKNRSKYL